MDVYRIWYCRCTGKPLELSYEDPIEEEVRGEPVCRACGASPSSDPRKTISYRDVEDWKD
jgi:hypothetical protein